MKQLHLASSLILTASIAAIALGGCNPGQSLAPLPVSEDGGDQGFGGEAGAATVGGGGTATNGGTTSGTVGGTASTPTGGNNANGGTTSGAVTGGTPGQPTGGTKSNTGGTPGQPTGGNPPSPTGGSQNVSTGGNPPAATGGNPPAATGGSPVITGTGGAANSGTTVTFSSSGKGIGAMTGWAFVAMGATDTITDPTCGSAKTAITSTTPCATSVNWSASGLCVTGNVPIADAPTYASWGLSVGLNATDPAGNGIGQAFTSVTITVTGTPSTNLRAIVHRKGDPDATSYCFAMTSGTAIPLTSFVTDCYATAPAGAKITTADIPNIDKISVQVSAGTVAIPVTNLCLAGITFG